MAQITKKQFLQFCKGARLIKIENFDSAAPYESTAFVYRCQDNSIIYKIETRSLKPNGQTTYNYYK